jgi:hypothetical protein
LRKTRRPLARAGTSAARAIATHRRPLPADDEIRGQ